MKKLYVLFCLLILNANAIDLSNYGDFESRSTIMKSFSQKQISQDTKEALQYKKLTATTSCLIKQIETGNIENIRLLLNAKVNPNIPLNTEYPLYIAAKKNNFEIVKILVENGARLDNGFNSELYEAVKNKNSQLAWYLLSKGANVNYRDMVSANSIVYIALKNNMLDIARELVKKGVSADNKTLKYIKKHNIKITQDD